MKTGRCSPVPRHPVWLPVLLVLLLSVSMCGFGCAPRHAEQLKIESEIPPPSWWLTDGILLAESGADSARVHELVKRSGGREEHPDADFISLFDRNLIQCEQNGDYTEVRHSLRYILTEDGKEGGRTRQFHYDRQHQELEILVARVHKPDGRQNDIPAENIADVAVPDWSGQVFEDDWRRRVVNVAGLQIGDVLEISVRFTNHELLRDNFDDYFSFQSYDPIQERTVVISTPTEMELNWHAYQGELFHREETRGDRSLRLWQAREIPLLVYESMMSPDFDVSPVLRVTTFSDWRAASRYMHEVNRGKADTNDSLRAVVHQITDGKSTRDEKILAINHYVSSQIRYVGTAMDAGMYLEPHAATFTFERGYGICRDKAILAIAMLEEIGVKALLTGVNGMGKLRPESPTLIIQHAVVAIPQDDGSYLFLDPTMETQAEYGETYLSGRHVIPITDDGAPLYHVPDLPPARNAHVLTSVTQLEEDLSLSGRIDIAGSGLYHMFMRDNCIGRPGSKYERYWQNMATEIHPSAVVSDLHAGDPQDLSTPFAVSLHLDVDRYADPLGDFLVLQFPLLKMGPQLGLLSRLNWFSRQEDRRHPIELFAPQALILEDEIRIPDGYQVRSLPKQIDFRRPPLRAFLTFTEGEGKVRLKGEVAVEECRLAPEDFPALRELAQMMSTTERGAVILARPGESTPERESAAVADEEPLSAQADLDGSPCDLYNPAVWDLAPGNDWSGIAAQVPTPETFPDASAILLKSDLWIRLFADSRRVVRKHRLTAPLTDEGRKLHGNYSATYHALTDSLSIDLARTVLPDGGSVSPGEDGITDLAPGWAARVPPDYAHQRRRTVCFASADLGSALEIRTTQRGQDPDVRGLAGTIYPRRTDGPIVDQRVTIVIPPGMTLKYEFLNCDENVEVIETAESREYRFHFVDQSLIIWENHDCWPCFAPMVLYTTYESWDDASAAWQQRFGEAAQQTAGVPEALGHLVGSRQSAEERLAASVLHVSSAIDNIGTSARVTRYAFSSPSRVLADGSGNARDKALLLVAMLRADGFQAYPALAGSEPGEIVLEIPNLRQIPNVLVAVRTDREGTPLRKGNGSTGSDETLAQASWCFFDPTADDASYGYIPESFGEQVLLLAEGHSRWVPLARREDEGAIGADCRLAASVDGEGGIAGSFSYSGRGYHDWRARCQLQGTIGEDLEIMLSKRVNRACSGATAESAVLSDPYDLRTPIHLEQAFAAPGFAVRQGQLMILRIPPFPYEWAQAGSETSLKRRRHPIWIPSTAPISYEVVLDLPEGMVPLYLPEGEHHWGGLAETSVICEYDAARHRVTWRHSLRGKSRVIPVAAYPAYKQARDAVQLPRNRVILLSAE